MAGLAAAVLVVIGVASPAAAQRTGDQVRVVLKFVKRAAGAGVRFDPATCAACSPITDANWNADNDRETVIALWIPRMRTLELGFDHGAANVRRVILEGGDVPFNREGNRLTVAMPPVAAEAVTAAEVATHIVEPGMVLRFEHADPARRAGVYAQGLFPAVQRAAANALEFAQREVVRELGLGEWVERNHLGRIQIMGFDTNAPHDHRDAPPHIHMHLRWPDNTGTQIGHYYIGEDGLLSHNVVGVKGSGAPQHRFGRGQPFTTVAPDGRAIYTHRITPEGWLELGRAGAAPCVIRPSGNGGFAAGASVACPGMAPRRIAVADDLAAGVLTVDTDTVREVFRYDRDTGALLSPSAVPVPPPSVFVNDG
ncbi:hypothetical protein [Sphingomonas sp. PP-CE-1G-424]|uniref:hypothetical protein n=1 Tax=Sphingomonas sp. PP-CE-1G-424 TaxID=2135658 RepID=UPI001A9F98B7|nr:hypothetical protein [Sphingomonas sp. PP-CE-1G-424]